MSFFGLTYCGPPSYFRPHLSSVQNINDFPDENFQAAFEALKAEGENTLAFSDLAILLSRVFKSEANPSNLKAFQDLLSAGDASELKARPLLKGDAHLSATSVDTITLTAIEARQIKEQTKTEDSQTNRRFSWADFHAALRIARVGRASSGSAGSCEFSSARDLQAKRRAHKRLALAPQEKYSVPITSNQEIGWHRQLPEERTSRRQNQSCAETKFAAALQKSGLA